MKLSDFNRLKKLMTLTTSDNEPEAAAAMRAANALLSRCELTWERVLDRSVKVVEMDEAPDGHLDEAPGNPHRHGSRPPSQELEEAFEVLESIESTHEGFVDMIADIRKQWEQGRKLSDKQRRVVIEAAQREREKRDRDRGDRPRWRRR